MEDVGTRSPRRKRFLHQGGFDGDSLPLPRRFVPIGNQLIRISRPRRPLPHSDFKSNPIALRRNRQGTFTGRRRLMAHGFRVVLVGCQGLEARSARLLPSDRLAPPASSVASKPSRRPWRLSWSACSYGPTSAPARNSRERMCLAPQSACHPEGIYADLSTPCCFVATSMNLAVMPTA
jgi:hypothetical protein